MKTNLCQYKKHSCFGCCGHTFGTEKETLDLFKENTELYNTISKKEFMKRAEKRIAQGGCKALIIKKDRVFCSLHPLQNKGKDYRDSKCQKNYLCETFKKFKTWSEEKHKKFLKFIDAKKLTHYAYSMGMDKGELLKEFGKITDCEKKNL